MIKKCLILLSLLIFILFCTSCTKESPKTTLQISVWGAKTQMDTFYELIGDFEKQNPNIKVEVIHIPQNYFQKLHLLIASNLTPDIIMINNINGKLYIESDKFEPLNKYFDNELSKNMFYSAAISPFIYHNKLYAIPRDISNMVIYYNKDIFDKNKINYPDENWTLADLLNISQKLTNNDNFGIGFEKNSLYWLPLIFPQGGGILNENLEVIINEERTKELIQFYSDLRNKYHVAPAQAEQASVTTSQMFLQNKLAMHICGMWCNGLYKKQKDLNYRTINLPKGDYPFITDASGYSISKTSKHKNEAWKLIKFLSSKSAQQKLSADGLILPARNDCQSDEWYAFTSTLDNTIPTPICSNYQEILDILNENLEKIFDNGELVNKNINDKIKLKLEKIVQRGIIYETE